MERKLLSSKFCPTIAEILQHTDWQSKAGMENLNLGNHSHLMT